MQAVASVVDSKVSLVEGENSLRLNTLLNGVTGGLDSIITKVQESEEVILSRLRDFPLISTRRQVMCGYHFFY